MIIEQFINDRIIQLNSYIKAVIKKTLHFTELDLFLSDLMEEWAQLMVTDETPSSAKERVFWHLIHELKLHGAQALHYDLFFLSEIGACLDFLDGDGSYPIDCIGWRPLA
jgi:hypothetical protein